MPNKSSETNCDKDYVNKVYSDFKISANEIKYAYS